MHILRDNGKITAVLAWPVKDGDGNTITEELNQSQIDGEVAANTVVDQLINII